MGLMRRAQQAAEGLGASRARRGRSSGLAARSTSRLQKLRRTPRAPGKGVLQRPRRHAEQRRRLPGRAAHPLCCLPLAAARPAGGRSSRCCNRRRALSRPPVQRGPRDAGRAREAPGQRRTSGARTPLSRLARAGSLPEALSSGKALGGGQQAPKQRRDGVAALVVRWLHRAALFLQPARLQRPAMAPRRPVAWCAGSRLIRTLYTSSGGPYWTRPRRSGSRRRN
mmetsp:Transcript_89079/g.288500  ORF Transcript_89079/g.288500 Transcript_89079/m.288500 type:complete len:225 (-) Transcript_89079:236-910(-)